jgi:hypothetical protein
MASTYGVAELSTYASMVCVDRPVTADHVARPARTLRPSSVSFDA